MVSLFDHGMINLWMDGGGHALRFKSWINPPFGGMERKVGDTERGPATWDPRIDTGGFDF